MATTTERLVIEMQAKQENVIKGINQVMGKLDDMEKKAQQTGSKTSDSMKKIAKALVAIGGSYFAVTRLTRAFTDAVKSAASFESKLAEVSTLLTGNVSRTMAEYEKRIRSMSRNSSADVNQLTGAIYQTISAGVRGSETVAGTLNLVGTAQKAAVAGVSDAKSAVDILTTALNSYGKTTDTAMEYSDNLFTAVRLGKTTFGEMANQLGMVTSIAAGADVPFNEVTSAIVAMTKAGLSTDIATTALRATLVSILSPSKELVKVVERQKEGYKSAAEALSKKGLVGFMQMLRAETGGNAAALQKLIPNVRALVGASVMAGTGFESLVDALDQTKKGAGATNEAFAKMENTFEYKAKMFRNTVADVMISIGKDLLPAVQKVMMDVKAWFDLHGDELVMKIGAVAAAIGEVVGFLGDMVKVAGKVMSFTNNLFSGFATSKLEELGKQKAMARMTPKGWQGGMKASFALPETSGATAGAAAPFVLDEAAFNAAEDPAEAEKRRLEKIKRARMKMMDELAKYQIDNAADIEKIMLERDKEIADAEKLAREANKNGAELIGQIKIKYEKILQKHIDDRNRAEQQNFEEMMTAREEYEKEQIAQERRRYAFIAQLEREFQDTRASIEEENMERNAHLMEVAYEKSWSKFFSDVATGFAEAIGQKLFGVFSTISGAIMAPFGQIQSMIGSALGGAGLSDLKGMGQQFVGMMGNIGQTIGPFMEWLANEGAPQIINAFVQNLPIVIDALLQYLPELLQVVMRAIPDIVNVVISRIPDIIATIIEMLPIIMTELINMIPSIVFAFIKQIPRLALEVGKAIAKAFLKSVTGDWGGGTSWLKGEEGLLPNEVPIIGKLHRGGMVTNETGLFANSVSTFANAIKAHTGLYMTPTAQPGDVPIIAQVGEAVLNRAAVSRVGGEAGVNALNKGLGGKSQPTNNFYIGHMMSTDTESVIDSMMVDSHRRGGLFSKVINQGVVPGFKSWL